MNQLKKTPGGESFEISVARGSGGSGSARVAMNRPQRPLPSLTSSGPRRASVQDNTDGSVGGKRATPPNAAALSAAVVSVESDLDAATPVTSSFGFGVSPDGSDAQGPVELLSPSVPLSPTTAGQPLGQPSWTYTPPPNTQRTFYFPEDGLHFTSEFDSGNLIQVERVAANRYHLYSSPDCGNSSYQTNNRQWFHFAVRGATKGTVLQIQMIGLMVSKMYSFGWTPVAAVLPSRPVYSRFATKVVVNKLESAPATPGYPGLQYRPVSLSQQASEGGDEDDEGGKVRAEGSPGAAVAMNVGFEYRFDCDIPVDSQYPFGHPLCPCVYIASNHPYSFQRLQKSIALWQQTAQTDGVYLHREVLAVTLDGRPVDLLTITSRHGGSAEDQLEPCFADGVPISVLPSTVDSKCQTPCARPLTFPGKRYVLLTARVHPGEAPASHILQGCIDFLLDAKDPRAQVLLKSYVFVVVPMINPDGVVRGHSRADTTGQNLNRMYRNPDPMKHPAIYALRHAMLALQATGRLALYIDMHAHANKRGAFFFGNAMPAVDQVQNMLYAKLVSLNTPHLEFTSCNFSESNMFAMGKNGETKDGSSRVTIFQETGFVHSYTIETSYVTGVVQNAIAANPAIPGEEIDILPGTPSPKYNQATFADVGKALLVSLLDLNDENPASRLPQGPHRSLKGVTQWLQRQLVFEVFDWHRKQAALRSGLPTTSPLGGAATGGASLSGTNAGVNVETVTPLSLPLSAVASLDLLPSSGAITLKGNKTIPPTTMSKFDELVADMKRTQTANFNSGSGSSRSAPPLSRVASMTRGTARVSQTPTAQMPAMIKRTPSLRSSGR